MIQHLQTIPRFGFKLALIYAAWLLPPLAAKATGGGTNFLKVEPTYAGIIILNGGGGVSPTSPAYLNFQMGPPAAVAAGAAWRSSGSTNYSSVTNFLLPISSTNDFTVQFKPIPGWILPPGQSGVAMPGVLSIGNAFYSASNPVMVINSEGIGLTGTPGTVCQVQCRTNLIKGQWLPLATNTISTAGFNLAIPKPFTNTPAMFYRALWLTNY